MRVLVSLYLWFVGGLYFLFFLVSALVLSCVLPEEKYDPLLKKMPRILFRLMFIKVEVSGHEKLEPGKTYLYMSNHVSLFDIPLLGGFVPGIVRGIEALRQHRWPLYGYVVGRLGNRLKNCRLFLLNNWGKTWCRWDCPAWPVQPET